MKNCRFCREEVPPQVTICPQCQKPLQEGAETPQEALKEAPAATQNMPETFQPNLALSRAELDPLLQEMQREWEKQRLALVRELEKVRDQLAKKEDKTETTPAEGAPNSRFMDILLLVASLVFLIILALIILYSKPNHRADALAVLGTALVVFGGFYLAKDLYGPQKGTKDLYGPQKGLLAKLTAYVTYMLVGILGGSAASTVLISQDIAFAPQVILFQHISGASIAGNDPTSAPTIVLFTRGALFCLFCGALIGLSGDWLTRPYKPSPWHKTILLELLFCFGFWALFLGMLLIILFPAVKNSAYLLTQLGNGFILLAIITVLFVRLYRLYIIQKLCSAQTDSPHEKPKHIVDVLMKTDHPWRKWTIFIASTLVIFSIFTTPIFLLFSAFWTGESSILGPLGVALGFIFSGTFASVFAPLTVKWVDRWNTRRLGTIGLFLVSLGAILAIIPALIDLFAW